MKIIRDKIEGDIILNDDTQLHGMINGGLILKEKSEVYLHGMVNGDIINKGGKLEIYGTVNGKVLKEGGETVVDAEAIVRDGIL